MVMALGREFERETNHKLDLNFNTVGAQRARLQGDEVADLVILSDSAIAALNKNGLFLPGSVTDLGRTVTGVVIKEGAPQPDIATPEVFKQVLLKARSVSYSDPAAGGSSGTYFAGLLDKLGIADAIGEKAVLGKRGYEVAVKGKNGFVCFVERSWTAGFDDPQFWNPRIRAPNCFNPPAVGSVLPQYLKRTELALAGANKQRLVEEARAAFASHSFVPPEAGSFSFMLSRQG